MKRFISVLCILALAVMLPVSPVMGQQINQTAATLTQTSTFTQNCATAGSCVVLPLNPLDRTASIMISGTFGGAGYFFEASNSGGAQWNQISGPTWQAGAAVSSSQTTGAWTFDVAGKTTIRVRQSSLTSGSAIVSLSSSPAGSSVADHP